jgi:hypothetical protein
MRRFALLALCGAALAACKKKDAAPADAASGVVVGLPAAEEVEPNDRIERATRIELGRPVRGRLQGAGKRGDIDFFLVTSTEPKGLLRAEVKGVPGVDVALSAWSAREKRQLTRANNTRAGGGEVLPNVGVSAGDYAVVVRAVGRPPASSDVPYELTVTVVRAEEGAELEPNDKRLDAQEMEPGRRILGFHGRRGDTDWFKLKLPETAGDHDLRVEMTAVPGVPGATLEVQDEIEVSLAKGRVSRETGVLFPNLWVRPKQAVLYVLVSAGKGYNALERFTLQATLQKRTGPAEQEPNDRPPLATPIRAGEAVRAYLTPAGDVDWFALDAPAPSIARLSVTGIDKVDLVLSVHDAAGAQRVSTDEGTLREGEVLPNVFLPRGRSLVRVSGKKRQENVFTPYELTGELRPDPGDEEIEPNDGPASATPIVSGVARKGWIYPRGDVDVYRLDVGAGAARRFRIDVRGIPKVPLQLVLKETTGGAVAHVGPRPPVDPLSLEKDLLPGTYYLAVSGGKLSNPRDPYEIRVSTP